MKLRNYFDIGKSRAHNTVLDNLTAAFADGQSFTSHIILRTGDEFVSLPTAIADCNADPWESPLFVTRFAEYTATEDTVITEVGYGYGNTMVTQAVFDNPVTVAAGESVTVTAHLFLEIEETQRLQLTRGDNPIVRAMLGIEGFNSGAWQIFRSKVNLPNLPVFRAVQEGAAGEAVNFAATDKGVRAVYTTGANNDNFEILLCRDRVAAARVNHRLNDITTVALTVACQVANEAELADPNHMFTGVTSVQVNSQHRIFAATRFSYHLDEVDIQNFPYKLPRVVKAATEFDGRYLAVCSQSDINIYDTAAGFRRCFSQDIKVDENSCIAIAGNGRNFVSQGKTLRVYRLDGQVYVLESEQEPGGIIRSIEVANGVTPVVAVEFESQVVFYTYQNTVFTEVFAVATDGRMFFHKMSAARLQFFSPSTGTGGEFIGTARNSMMPEFAAIALPAATNILGRVERVSGSAGLAMFEGSGGEVLLGTHLFQPTARPDGKILGLYRGRYLIAETDNGYGIYFVSVPTSRCVLVREMPKLSGFADLAVCGQWVAFMYKDGAVKLFASRYDAVSIHGGFAAGNTLTVFSTARANFRANQNLEITFEAGG